MPEDKKVEGEAEVKPTIDAFGNSDAPIEVKVESKKEEKKFDTIPEDHPTIVSLKSEIAKVKEEYGGNLSGQREVIKGLEAKIEALGKGKGADGGEAEEDVIYKKDEIKWSKDLTKEERDDMTDTEIKQMDEIARMKEAQNKLYSAQVKASKGSETTKVTDLNNLVQGTAKELAGGNVELANEIIESSKQFSYEGLTETQVKERVMNAAKLLPSYKPPKEQVNRNGAPVKKAGEGSDPFGVDKIVEEATKGSNGAYAL